MSKKQKWTKEDVAIKELSLWDENARFPDKYFKQDEEELIKYFLSKKGFKIEELAEEIVEEFDLPQLEKIIVFSHKGRKIVLEGNRRLAVYKLLANPKLTNDPYLESKFTALSTKIAVGSNLKLECLVTDDKEQGLRFIERKHLKGNNEVSWRDNERAHYKERRGSANKAEKVKVAITKYIKYLDIPELIKETVLGAGYVTSFWRIMTGSAASEVFKMSLDEIGDLEVKDKDFKDKLKVVITDVLDKATYEGKIISRLKQNDIKQYLESISKSDFKRAETYVEKAKSENLFGEEVITTTSAGSTKIIPKANQRSYLIPKTCRLNIPERKINNIYRELRDDLLINDSKQAVPNATGVLFRVFLEVSLDYYYSKRCGKTFVKDTSINQKIDAVTKFMEDNGIANKSDLKNIRTVSSGKTTDILHIDRFHEYVHSSTIEPESNGLKSKWNNVEDFFVTLWLDLEKSQKSKNNKKKV